MTHSAITVDKLCKVYRIGLKDEVHDTFVGAFTEALKTPWKNWRRLSRLNTFNDQRESDDTFWALRDVSFEVAEGEVVGIIGRNGAGKSTLLKILSRITEPTSGRAVIRGRVSSLLEVGTGFHQELSGRENVYMNGTILGMTKREIDRKFDEIVDFSGVEKFLDTPIKHYSSGMKVRLAFAVAAHLEPEILIIDEVLAVGDAEFQKKCLGKMHDVAQDGRTVLFVSHNMIAVQNLCSRAILLHNGSVKSIGLCDEIIDEYFAESAAKTSSTWRSNGSIGNSAVAFQEISVLRGGIQPNHSLSVTMTLQSTRPHERAFVAIDFFDQSGSWIMQAIPTLTPFLVYSEQIQEIAVRVELPPLIPGDYLVGIWIGSSLTNTIAELREAVTFCIDESPTPGRLIGHSVARGFIVPRATIVRWDQLMTNKKATVYSSFEMEQKQPLGVE